MIFLVSHSASRSPSCLATKANVSIFGRLGPERPRTIIILRIHHLDLLRSLHMLVRRAVLLLRAKLTSLSWAQGRIGHATALWLILFDIY